MRAQAWKGKRRTRCIASMREVKTKREIGKGSKMSWRDQTWGSLKEKLNLERERRRVLE